MLIYFIFCNYYFFMYFNAISIAFLASVSLLCECGLFCSSYGLFESLFCYELKLRKKGGNYNL